MKIAFALVLSSALSIAAQQNPSNLPKMGTVDPRFQSYNVEMVEVIGGRFWKPCASKAATTPTTSATPGGIDPALFEQRQPIDLANARLRKLAAALGPAYMRVSGTWANTVYFHDADTPAPASPPEGFGGVLTRAEWKGVVAFANATDAKIVTSFATSQGTRDAAGTWTPAEAAKFLRYNRSIGGSSACLTLTTPPADEIHPQGDPMSAITAPRITPFLWFDGNAEQAVDFYCSVFQNSRTLNVTRSPAQTTVAEGKVLVIEFELDGQRFTALNGGPAFQFNKAISFSIACQDQQEIDHYWARLTDGGAEVQCGWLEDRFGLSWQVVPANLGELIRTPNGMQAMRRMVKFDIAALRAAAAS